ncbi:MAG: FN3 associated domain-containing protein [Leeuwenhoekiella sp.]
MIKTLKTLSLFFVLVIILQSCNSEKTEVKKKEVEAKLSTPWTDKVDPENVLPEYPRPTQQRADWKNLNGYWQVETKALDSIPFGKELSKKIVVPFAVESYLSGLMEATDDLLYRKLVNVPQEWKNRDILLNFEGVDYEAWVYVNGEKVGEHKGAFDHFSFDITPFLVDGEEQEIIVKVHDNTNDGLQPVGKQVREPEGIFYTSTTGIWQTVWMEPVQKTHIQSYTITPDIDAKKAYFTADVANSSDNEMVEVEVFDNGKSIASAKGKSSDTLSLSFENPELWSPENPFLYSVKVKLSSAEEVTDSFESYMAMRKISLGKKDGKTQIFLNNEPYFQVGVLDQGYWPDGLMTPATEEAYVWDIQTFKDMGFNLLRKHAKAESQRWYYLCDKLGMLVWQDMPQMYPHADFEKRLTQQGKEEFEAEFKNLIADLYNNPSIVMWVVFNEGWGQYDTERLTNWVEGLDKSRLVSNASGWTDKNVGDIIDMHSYPGPDAYPAEENRATVLGEFGGLGLPLSGHLWQESSWGYKNMADTLDFKKQYSALWDKVWALKEQKAVSAVVYTQVSDVEGEVNGLVTYDRKVTKIPVKTLHDIHTDKMVSQVNIKSNHSIFIDDIKVTLDNRKGEPIYYTLDNTEPTVNSLKYTQPIVINKTATLKARSIDNDKSSDIASASFTKVESYKKPLPTEKSTLSGGISYMMYEGEWDKLPDFGEMKPDKDGKIETIDLAQITDRTANFGLVLNTFLEFDKQGIYTFQLKGDDGVRLTVDDEVLIDHDGIHGMDLNIAELPLAVGYHKIIIEYFQKSGGLGLELEVLNENGKKIKTNYYTE